jgi:hypothetical protein
VLSDICIYFKNSIYFNSSCESLKLEIKIQRALIDRVVESIKDSKAYEKILKQQADTLRNEAANLNPATSFFDINEKLKAAKTKDEFVEREQQYQQSRNDQKIDLELELAALEITYNSFC